MQPVDKFGRPIYTHIFKQLQEIGRILTIYGYSESVKKPNLFWRECKFVIFYADMRGTEEVPIWKVPSPMFYWNWKIENLDSETRSRAILIEWSRIARANIRFSFNEDRYEDLNLIYMKM
ncbi:MAG: hypothetical protein AB2L14_13095 [Candidatus Xenobiia bacterium LiM19]